VSQIHLFAIPKLELGSFMVEVPRKKQKINKWDSRTYKADSQLGFQKITIKTPRLKMLFFSWGRTPSLKWLIHNWGYENF
jgi:hypothetical protein